MEHLSYYRNLEIPNSDQSITAEPLILNCTGQCYLKIPVRNKNRRQDYYLKYITQGILYFRVAEYSAYLHPGDFIIIPPDTWYEYYSQNEGVTSYYWCHFTGNTAAHLLHTLSLETSRVYHAPDCIHELRTKFVNLFAEFTNRQAGFDISCAAGLEDILVTLLRCTTSCTHPSVQKLTTVDWLHRHFAENTSIRELAAMEHMSESWFRKIFRQQMGVSPNAYRISLRIQYACDLLATSDYSVSAISRLCGYEDTLYFIRLFKQYIGFPPGEYRRMHHTGFSADRS